MSEAFSISANRSEFDLGLCVSSGQTFRWSACGESWTGVDGKHAFRINVYKENELNRYDVHSNGRREDLENLFRMELDARRVREEIVRRGPELAPYVSAMAGLRLMRPSDPVETFFSFLCSANNHIARITGMVCSLAEYGPAMDLGANLPVVHRFPSVAVLAQIEEPELRSKSFGYRAATITSIARDLEARGAERYLQDLRRASYRDAHDELITFKGIGRKLADCIALFALDRTEAVPIDTHIWQAATRLYFPQWRETALTDLKYLEASEFLRNRFGDLAGWAQQCLFYENVLNWRKRG